jgi:hypothetical protein
MMGVDHPKLTQPQSLLLYILKKDMQYCVRNYRPAKRLVEIGLAEWVDDTDWLVATEAGRDWKSE